MKRLYAAITFLIIAISLCVFEQYTVEKTYNDTTEMINNAIEFNERNDYESTVRECERLAEYWNGKYPCLTAMIDHGSLDDAAITIASLKDLARNKSDELETELINAKSQIKSIRDNQKITFGNIF